MLTLAALIFPTQHESIVREIEEALRKEIIAASTLPERPRYICVTAYTLYMCAGPVHV